MKLSTIPKKSLAAAVCAYLYALWSAWTAFAFTATQIYLESELSVYSKAMGLISPLLAIALWVWYLIPNNRRYHTGLKIILGLIVAQAVVIDIVSFAGTALQLADIGRMALSLLRTLLSTFAILLFGALVKKSTEKPAALAMLVWFLVQNAEAIWKMFTEKDLSKAGMILAVLLTALLMVAPLFLHPVLERPILQSHEKETEQAHE